MKTEKIKMSRKARTKFVCDKCPEMMKKNPAPFIEEGESMVKGCILFFEEDGFNKPIYCPNSPKLEWNAEWKKVK